MIGRVRLLGILNITEDSFSDGGRYLAPDAAVAQARALSDNGADILDLGAASSNPNAKPVAPDVEIGRLVPVVAAMKAAGAAISVDSFSPAVQRWALEQRIDYINDIAGFPNASLYPEFAASTSKLIVMHSVQGGPSSLRVAVPANEIMDRVLRFFDTRLAELERAGVARNRVIVDPGMGFFLGTVPEASFEVLRGIGRLKAAFGLPVVVSLSRKSFLRRLTGRSPLESGAASLAAELFAARQGADFIRTHDPGALRDGLVVQAALDGPPPLA
ncbi:MAG: dihydropteroate synthase [Rhizomicrobium sp.]